MSRGLPGPRGEALLREGLPKVSESTPIATAAAVMAYEGLTSVPVVGDGGRLVGVVSSLDILRWLARVDGYVVPEVRPSERHAARKPERRRVLVADDDEHMRRLVSFALRKDHFEVVEAANGEELLEYVGSSMLDRASTSPPDVIISDIRMPGFSGLQVLAGLKRAHVETPVVLITALDDPKTSVDAERLGAAAIFRKPFDPEQLRRLVRGLVS